MNLTVNEMKEEDLALVNGGLATGNVQAARLYKVGENVKFYDFYSNSLKDNATILQVTVLQEFPAYFVKLDDGTLTWVDASSIVR